MRCSELILCLLLIPCSAASASMCVVNPDGSGEYPTIQEAIDAARDGDFILLGDGVFRGPGNRDIDFLGKDITVQSVSENAETCVIDCEGSLYDPHRAFSFHHYVSSNAHVKFITMMNGYVKGDWPTGAGGAIGTASGSPRITGCRFIGNYAQWGGAVGGYSCVTLERCTFYNNHALYRGGAVDGHGGCRIWLSQCTLVANGAPCGAGVGADDECHVTLLLTIIAFGPVGQAVCCTNDSDAEVCCSDVYGNAGGDWVDGIEQFAGRYGNFSGDPLFCDPTGNLRLLENSPCRPEANPGCGLIGAWPVGCTPPASVTYTVDAEGTGDFPTIQAAIDGARDGDTIELLDGRYVGDGNRDVDYGGKAITIRSRSGDPEACVLDCEGSAEMPHRGFLFQYDEGPTSRLEGITIEAGYAAGAWPGGGGGAIQCTGSTPLILGCRFVGNTAGWGGAVSANRGLPQLTQCTFIANRAVQRGGAADAYNDGAISLTHCTLVANAAACGAGVGANISCDIAIRNTIIAFSPEGQAVCCTNGSHAAASCSDVFGNAGGDYVNGLAGQEGQNGNISEDPVFCDLGQLDLRLAPSSPCAPENQPLCGLIGSSPVGCEDPAGIEEGAEISLGCSLGPIRPSPVTGSARVSYTVPPGSDGTLAVLSIHDLLGRRVRTLVDRRIERGVHWVTWDGRGEHGMLLPAGAYFCRLVVGDQKQTRQVMVVR